MGNYKTEHSGNTQKDFYNTASRSWEEIYKSKLVSAEEAIRSIKDGDTVVTGFACGEPFGIERALIENYKSFHDVKIVNMLSLGSSPWCRPEMEGHFTLNCLFASNSNRMHIASGVADFTPINFSEIPEVIRDFIRPRVSVCMVPLPILTVTCHSVPPLITQRAQQITLRWL